MASNWEKLQRKLQARRPAQESEGSHSIRDAVARARAERPAQARTRRGQSADGAGEGGGGKGGDAERAAAVAVKGELTRELGLDCEMVGAGPKDRSILAQVCIVNSRCEVVYVTHVKPKEDVVDYRTWVSGVKPEDLKHAPSFDDVRMHVGKLLDGRVLVGHGLKNDLSALLLKHPRPLVRDTTKYPAFTLRSAIGRHRPRKLKTLAHEFLGLEIQTGEHDPAEDAIAAMRLYQLVRRDWERWIAHRVQPPALEPRFKTRGPHAPATAPAPPPAATTAAAAVPAAATATASAMATATAAPNSAAPRDIFASAGTRKRQRSDSTDRATDVRAKRHELQAGKDSFRST